LEQVKKTAPGIALCLATAIPAYFLGKGFPLVGGPVFGILLGMILRMRGKPSAADGGIRYTSRKILQYSIILLGFQMNLFQILKTVKEFVLVLVFTLTAALAGAYFIGKALMVPKNLSTRVGVGTGICGGSAIAAAAPAIGAGDEEIAQSISTIFLFNILAVFLFPPLGRLFSLSDPGFGIWAGTAINDTSSVVAAGAAWSEAAGNETALTLATIVKLTRTLAIVPVTFFLAMVSSRQSAKGGRNGNFSFSKVFPWFVLYFLLTAICYTFLPIPENIARGLSSFGKFLIVMAMSAVGWNTDLKKLIKNGKKPILLGFCCWVLVAGVSLAVQFVTNLG
jgi:uncharacterized integral membrane protein (TIGR00698 family)